MTAQSAAPVLHNQPHHEDRVDLACAFRWTARFDMHEHVANHFSLAVNDDGSEFLINPSGRHFSRVRASELILCNPQAVGSGASGRSIVAGSLASHRISSLARTRAKCRQFGLIRNWEPSSLTASEKWLATCSCMSNRAVQRNAAARSTRSS